MHPTMQELVKKHWKLKKRLGDSHPETLGALERAADFQRHCTHPAVKRAAGGILMCAECNLPRGTK